MADSHPPTSHDLPDDEPSATAKSAEDRKAASALASLDAAGHDDASPPNSNKQLDSEAVNKAMKSLGGAKPASAAPARNKNVKVDEADVVLLVDQLELPRAKATDLLRTYEGDAVAALRGWVNA